MTENFAAVLLLLCISLLSPVAAAAAPRSAFAPGETVEVREVVDGGEVVFADGRVLRLAGIEAPHLAPAQGAAWPFAAESKAALEKLVLGRAVELRFGESRRDRHGRLLGQLFADGRWVQGEMLRRGLARVQSAADNRAGVTDMLAIESRARESRRGLWRDPFYAVRKPEEARRYTGSFQLVEGTVIDAATVEGRLLLTFDTDWRHAFTLRLEPEALRLFRAERVDARALKGERLRVRGWIDGSERPTIDVTHPEQIERL